MSIFASPLVSRRWPNRLFNQLQLNTPLKADHPERPSIILNKYCLQAGTNNCSPEPNNTVLIDNSWYDTVSTIVILNKYWPVTRWRTIIIICIIIILLLCIIRYHYCYYYVYIYIYIHTCICQKLSSLSEVTTCNSAFGEHGAPTDLGQIQVVRGGNRCHNPDFLGFSVKKEHGFWEVHGGELFVHLLFY